MNTQRIFNHYEESYAPARRAHDEHLAILSTAAVQLDRTSNPKDHFHAARLGLADNDDADKTIPLHSVLENLMTGTFSNKQTQ